ncbi:MAG TPA: complex I NDUFA9 subunit family protein [Steroidobacteraceae bacterium]|nr:complex I NDUFA9 subunit family protein [Steroidobacteraceae bacterium]
MMPPDAPIAAPAPPEAVRFTRPRLNICVLGGTGFVGTEIVSQLASAGHWIRVPTRAPARGQHLSVLPTVEIVAADVHDRRVLAGLLADMDAAVNLVGILNESRRARFRDVHPGLAAKLIEEARTARVPRLLHMSAAGADAKQAPSKYLRSKGQAEALVRAAGSSLAVTIFRPSVIFGPGDSLTQRFAKLLRLAGGWMPLARASARFAPVYVGDVARAFARALGGRSTSGRTYELCGPDVLTLEQIVRASAAAAGTPCRIVRLPDILGRFQGLALGLLPGKPFTLDNFRSLTIDSLCAEDGLRALELEPRRLAAVMPTYLGGMRQSDLLNRFRAESDR